MSGRPAQRNYIGGGAEAPATNFFSAFWKTQVTAPDKIEGNIAIAVSSALFAGAIIFTRNFGDLLLPAF
ncbi:hypothetical protein [Phaffia rhodozyma]|uniref:Uncharacterized protein n=1 Tax=Phaffia rhodozyma TaxID=264483 RepID=A0A0F7SHA5_PHARH|nr:hypothetical protein [Phaffia rhodozyma]